MVGTKEGHPVGREAAHAKHPKTPSRGVSGIASVHRSRWLSLPAAEEHRLVSRRRRVLVQEEFKTLGPGGAWSNVLLHVKKSEWGKVSRDVSPPAKSALHGGFWSGKHGAEQDS